MSERLSPDRSLFQAVMLAVAGGIFLPIVNGVAVDFFRQPIDNAHLLPVLAGEIILGFVLVRRELVWPKPSTLVRLLGAVLSFGVILGIGLFVGWPTFLPLAPSADAIQQYALIDYVTRFHHLVDGASGPVPVGQLSDYPVGAGLLVAFLAQSVGRSALLLLQPASAVLLAVAATFAYGVVSEMTDDTPWNRLGATVFGLATFLWPVSYVVGPFLRDLHLNQLVGLVGLMGLWYWSIVFVRTGSLVAVVGMVGLEAAIAATDPILLPLSAGAFLAQLVDPTSRRSVRHWVRGSPAMVFPAIALLGLLVRGGRPVATVFQTGMVISPTSLPTLPLPLLVLAAGGLTYAALHERLRPAIAMVGVTVGQVVALTVLTGIFGAAGRRAATDLLIVLAVELAVFGCLALLVGLRYLTVSRRTGSRGEVGAASAIVAIALLLFVREAWLSEFGRYDPRPTDRPVLSFDQIAVANWVGTNLPGQKLLYFTDTSATADWVDVGLLKKPRAPENKDVVPATVAEYMAWLDAKNLASYGFVAQRFGEIVGPESVVLFQSGDAGIIRRRTDDPAYDPTTERLYQRATLVGRGLALRLLSVDRSRHAPGDSIGVTVSLRTTAELNRHYIVEVRLRDPSGQILSRSSMPLTSLTEPVRIAVGGRIDVLLTLAVPPSTPPGQYSLEFVFFDDYWGTIPVDLGTGKAGNTVDLGPLLIASNADLPPAGFQPAVSVGSHLGDQLDLVGISPPSFADNAVAFDGYWRATRKLAADYTIFVQLLDAQGRPVGQDDTVPWGGRYPTSAWEPGQVVRDHYRFTLPANLPPGQYRLIAGAYLLATLQRLPVVDATGQAHGDFVLLKTVTLPSG